MVIVTANYFDRFDSFACYYIHFNKRIVENA